MKKIFLGLIFGMSLLPVTLPAHAQQPKIPRIGFVLGTSDSDPRFMAFRTGLQDTRLQRRKKYPPRIPPR